MSAHRSINSELKCYSVYYGQIKSSTVLIRSSRASLYKIYLGSSFATHWWSIVAKKGADFLSGQWIFRLPSTKGVLSKSFSSSIFPFKFFRFLKPKKLWWASLWKIPCRLTGGPAQARRFGNKTSITIRLLRVFKCLHRRFNIELSTLSSARLPRSRLGIHMAFPQKRSTGLFETRFAISAV